MFGDRHRHACDIDLLEGIFSQKRQRYITGDRYHRNGIHVRGRNAGNQIRRAGTAGRHTHTDFSGCTRIAICCMCSTLFMRCQHMENLIASLYNASYTFKMEPPGYPNTTSTPCSFKHSMTISAPVRTISSSPFLSLFLNFKYSASVSAGYHFPVTCQISGGYLRLSGLPFCPSLCQHFIRDLHIQTIFRNIDADDIALFYQCDGTADSSLRGKHDQSTHLWMHRRNDRP